MTMNPPCPRRADRAGHNRRDDVAPAFGNAQNTAATLTQMAEHKQAIDDATAAKQCCCRGG